VGGRAPVTAGPAGRRSWMTVPGVAVWSLGVLIVLFCAGLVLLAFAAREAESDIAVFAFAPVTAAVGFVVARRQPGNPLGWMVLALAAISALGPAAGAYAVLSYRLGHHLPLAAAAVFLALWWCPLIVMFPLVILLFPDGRLPSPRWRPVLWGYLAVGACWPISVYAVAISAVAAGDVHILPGGDLKAVDNPAGSSAWLGSVEAVILPVLAVFWLVFVARQVLSWRRADGERRQQLKWLMSGAAVCMAATTFIAVGGTLDTSASPAFQAMFNVVAVGIGALPVSIGVAILKYRLYDIDRIISRTLAYAIVTGLLVGVYAGLVLLATGVFRFHSTVAVAAATLAAAALFAPLRRRVQRAVDRRFNRARYDADLTVAAFASRLKDAVDLDAVRDDLAGVVQNVLEPVHVSVWTNERG
jgi:Ca2+/Na+ antiporter